MVVIEPLSVRAYNLGVGKRENQKHPKQREKTSVKELQSGRTGVKEKKIVSDLKAGAIMTPASPSPHHQPPTRWFPRGWKEPLKSYCLSPYRTF